MTHAHAGQIALWAALLLFFTIGAAVRSVGSDDQLDQVADMVARIGHTIAAGFCLYALLRWGVGLNG